MEDEEVTVNRLYRCGLCGMMSDDLQNLRDHLLSVHVSSAAENPSDVPGHVKLSIQPDEPTQTITHEDTIPHQPIPEGQSDLQQEHSVASEYDEQTELETDKQLQQRAAAAVAEHEKAQAELQQAFSNATDHQVTQQELEQAFQNATEHHAVQTELQQAFQNAISNNPQTTVSALDDHDVNLKFKVKIPHGSMQLFPKHIKPVLSFTCSYCEFKHHSFKEVSMHLFDKHPKKLNNKQRSEEYLKTAAQEVAVVDNSAYLTSKKMKRSKRLLKETSDTSEQENSEDVFKPPPTKVKREFSCLKCHTKTDNDKLLEIHKQCHVEGSDQLVCCFCGKEAPKVKAWYGLYIHMVNKHPDIVPAPLQCAVCKKGFVKEYDLIKHMSTHTSDKPFECEHCGLAFKCHSNFKQHQILRHRVGTPEERDKILQKIKEKKMATLDRASSYIACDRCSYKTKSNVKYKEHLKTHTGEKDHHCGYCSYKTGDKSALTRHMWRHRKEKPYNCRFCDFDCIQRPQIIAHYKNKHSLHASDAKKFIQHISGSRRYEDDLDEDDHIGILDMGPMGPVVQVIQEDDNPDVNTDNTVNFELLTEAAEGLLAASQIELHTT